MIENISFSSISETFAAKSNVYGVGVLSEEIEDMVHATGCAPSMVPFLDLGLPIGKRICYLLNLFGHLFLGGGSGDQKKMAWIKWDTILASYEKGGLNIGSLKAFNLALLQKWRWRLVTNSDSLWVRVVKAIHGDDTGFGHKECKISGSRNEEALENLLSEVVHVSVNNSPDLWQWSIANDGVFSVHDTRIHVDNVILPSHTPSTRV
ncbi:hypothetical protein Tco_0008430 [Tanacetum coccineum]